METRPFRLLGDTLLRPLRLRMQARLADWQAEWGITLPGSPELVQIERQRLERQRPVWRQALGAHGMQAWLHLPEELQPCLRAQLFDGKPGRLQVHAESSLVADVAEQACDALLQMLLQAVGETGATIEERCTTLPEALCRPGHDALMLAWRLRDQALYIVFAGLTLSVPSLPPRPPLHGLKRALANQRVSLRALVTEVELSLGQLETLHAGDVIRLDKRLDQLHEIHGPNGLLCRGHIGSQRGQRAIEVTK